MGVCPTNSTAQPVRRPHASQLDRNALTRPRHVLVAGVCRGERVYDQQPGLHALGVLPQLLTGRRQRRHARDVAAAQRRPERSIVGHVHELDPAGGGVVHSNCGETAVELVEVVLPGGDHDVGWAVDPQESSPGTLGSGDAAEPVRFSRRDACRKPQRQAALSRVRRRRRAVRPGPTGASRL